MKLIRMGVHPHKSLRSAAAIASLLLVAQFFVPAYSADDPDSSWIDDVEAFFSSLGGSAQKGAEKTEEGVSTGVYHARKGILKGAEETEKGLNKAAEVTGKLFRKAGNAIDGADD